MPGARDLARRCSNEVATAHEPSRSTSSSSAAGTTGSSPPGCSRARGARVTVLERRSQVGGAAITEQPWGPDFNVTALSYVVSLMPPTIVQELELERHGYKVYPQHGYFVAVPRRPRAAAARRRSRAPARRRSRSSRRPTPTRSTRWDAWLGSLADVLGPLLTTIPPRVGSRRPRDLVDQARARVAAARARRATASADVTRLFTMSIADLLDEYFESPQMQGVLAVSGVIGTWAGPRSAGTAYVMAHHKIGDVGDGQLGSWGFPEGGMGGVSRALRDAADRQRRDGAHRRAGRAHRRAQRPRARRHARVGRGAARRRRRRGDPSADHVPRAHRPRAAARPTSSSASSSWQTRSGTVKVNVAVDRLPEFTAKPGFDPEVHGGTIVLAESLDDIEGAFQDAVAGRAAALPFADICIPSVFDPTLAPEGKHVVSMFTQWVPHTCATEPDQARARRVRRPGRSHASTRSRPASPTRSCTAR